MVSIKDLMQQTKAQPVVFADPLATPIQVNPGLRNLNLDYSQLSMSAKPYYPPGNVLFELSLSKELLKKNTGLKEIH